MRTREERPTSNYETKDKKKKGQMERWGPEVEERMHSSDVLAGWVLDSGGGGCEPGIILVSHCLLFSNQLLSSAAPWKRVNEGSKALECQATVRGAPIKKRGWREQGDVGERSETAMQRDKV